MILGDFKAKVGKTPCNTLLGNIVLDLRNKRKDRLIKFTTHNSFTIANAIWVLMYIDIPHQRIYEPNRLHYN